MKRTCSQQFAATRSAPRWSAAGCRRSTTRWPTTIRRSIRWIRVRRARRCTSSGTRTCLMPLYLRGHCNLAMLLSRHRDADILGPIARHMGFDSIRGSTNRGGAKAMRELMRISRRMNLCTRPGRSARPAAHAGPRADLSGVAAWVAAGRDGFWIRSSLADEHLGPVCNSSAWFAGSRDPQPAIEHPAQSSIAKASRSIGSASRRC